MQALKARLETGLNRLDNLLGRMGQLPAVAAQEQQLSGEVTGEEEAGHEEEGALPLAPPAKVKAAAKAKAKVRAKAKVKAEPKVKAKGKETAKGKAKSQGKAKGKAAGAAATGKAKAKAEPTPGRGQQPEGGDAE
jgi:hypothetical protein